MDFDTWFVEQICAAASDRAASDFGVQSLVVPDIPFGPTPEHRSYGAGYIHIAAELHDALVFSALASLADQGFLRIIVWRGWGGHDLRDAMTRFNMTYKEKAEEFLPAPPYQDVWCRLGYPSVPGGHADSVATSIVLHLQPTVVLIDKIADPGHGEVDWQGPGLDSSCYSSSGVIGDPNFREC